MSNGNAPNLRSLGTIVLLVLGVVSVALAGLAYVRGVETPDMLLFFTAVAAFGLYVLGAIFFNYSVTFRTTIKPSDPLSLRMFQAGVGLLIWGATVWALIEHL